MADGAAIALSQAAPDGRKDDPDLVDEDNRAAHDHDARRNAMWR
jgi:hypothetical protein